MAWPLDSAGGSVRNVTCVINKFVNELKINQLIFFAVTIMAYLNVFYRLLDREACFY